MNFPFWNDPFSDDIFIAYQVFDSAFQAACYGEQLARSGRIPRNPSSPLETIKFPYHSHFWIPKDMGIVWVQLSQKGVPLVGGPWNHHWTYFSEENIGFDERE